VKVYDEVALRWRQGAHSLSLCAALLLLPALRLDLHHEKERDLASRLCLELLIVLSLRELLLLLLKRR
jgi:hypothetical protein